MRLSDVTQFLVPESLARESLRLLRESGVAGFEAIILWAGRINEDSTCDIELTLRPAQTAVRTSQGLLARVDGDEMFRMNRRISDEGLRLVAQLHTHPDDAYHSDTDDRFALVTARGSVSVVIPFFASGEMLVGDWAVYRLGNDWRSLSPGEAEQLIQIVEDD